MHEFMMPLDEPAHTVSLRENLFDLSDDTSLDEACASVFLGGLALVRNKDGFPLGLLDAGLALRWVGRGPGLSERALRRLGLDSAPPPGQERLSHRAHQLIPVATAGAAAPLSHLLIGVLSDGVLLPYALLFENRFVGFISATTVSDLLTRYFRSRGAPALDAYFNLFRSGARGQSLIDPLDPGGGGGAMTCWCCPDDLNGTKPHRVDGRRLSRRRAPGAYYCPDHRATVITKSVGCLSC